MTRPFVVDANVFKEMYKELEEGLEGLGKFVFEAIFRSDHIVLDDGGRIRQEWKSCSCGDQDELFSVWITQRIVEDRIRLSPVENNSELRAKLKEFGMPNKDRVYFYLATHNVAYGIVSEDSDMYDPAAKKWPPKKKRKLMEGGKSCVAKYMRKKFDIAVMPMCHVEAHCP